MQPDIALLCAIVICLALIVVVALVAGIALTLSVLGYTLTGNKRVIGSPDSKTANYDHRDY